MRKISILFVFGLLMASCEKDSNNMTVLLNQSGTVTVKVTDSNQVGFKGAEVSIYSSFPEGERIYLDSTDINGTCNIGKVLQGQYEYYVHAVRDNKAYSYSEYFQVIAGDNKVIEVNPFLNVGDAILRIVNYYSVPIADINVALIPHPIYSNMNYYFPDLINKAYAIGKTDSKGMVEFQDMPAGAKYNLPYSVLVYIDSENYDYRNYYVYITRDSEQYFTIEVNL